MIDRVDGRAPRILLVSEQALRGGAETSTTLLAASLVGAGLDCRLAFAWRGPMADEARALGVPLLPGAGRFVPSRYRMRMPAILAAATSRRYDLVHVSSLERRCRGVGLAACRAGVRTVAHLRTDWQVPAALELHHAGAWVVTNSSLTETDLRALGCTRVTFVPNGLDPAWAEGQAGRRDAVRAELGVPPGATMAVLVANVAPYKALDLAFPAVALAQRADPDLWLVHVGALAYRSNAGYAERVDSLVRAGGAAERTLRLGTRTDVAAITAAADLAIVPSHGEGTARAVLEAWACSVPVVAADAPGLSDLVVDGVNGVRVRLADTEATAAAVGALAADPSRRRELGAAGRASLEHRYTHAHHAGALLELYGRMLAADLAGERP